MEYIKHFESTKNEAFEQQLNNLQQTTNSINNF